MGRYLDKIGRLGNLAVSDVCSVDEEQPVVRLDAAVQRGDGVLQDLHDEDTGLGAAPADPVQEQIVNSSQYVGGTVGQLPSELAETHFTYIAPLPWLTT